MYNLEIIMLISHEVREELNSFFHQLRLAPIGSTTNPDKAAKIEQITAYLEVIHSLVRKYSRKRDLVFIDSGAGNCYLSYLVYYFYTQVEKRTVKIHCIDHNVRLMANNSLRAKEFGFEHMYFHSCDISDYQHPGHVDVVYSLHACDTATDKAQFLGLKTRARNIVSVSCCQHTIAKQMKGSPVTSGITRHRVFKEKLLYLVGDSMRALLMEMHGYSVDAIEFVSSRHTGKNIMLRATKAQTRPHIELLNEYELLKSHYNLKPALESYLTESQPSRGYGGEKCTSEHSRDLGKSVAA